jgi:hypothetical protein
MNREPDVKPVCYTTIKSEVSLTYRISLHLPVAVQRRCEVGLWVEDEDEAELGVVEPLHQSTQVYQLVLSEVLVQQAVRLSHSHSPIANM